MTDDRAGRRELHRDSVQLRDVLAVREFRGMVLAQVASEAGDQIARVALALLVLDQSGSPLLAAASFAISPPTSAGRCSDLSPTASPGAGSCWLPTSGAPSQWRSSR